MAMGFTKDKNLNIYFYMNIPFQKEKLHPHAIETSYHTTECC